MISTCSKKKNIKKNVYSFLIKKHLYMLEKVQNRKTSSNCKVTYPKELCCLKNQAMFSQGEHTDGLDPAPSPCLFLFAF